MAGKSSLQEFTTQWERAAGWAQTQGIHSNVYYPIYQMDSARVLAGDHAMSTAEIIRSITAAAGRGVTPVPSDHPDPWSFLGNAVNDLRNIFTGLAPNHLIPNIFDSIKQAVTQPSTWEHPLGEVTQGLFSANWDEVKKGLEQAGGVSGKGSILSWLPGVAVAGELAQGGVGEVMSHPVSSFLDVAPFAPVGRLLDAGMSAERAAEVAGKFGLTADQLRNQSIPSFIMHFGLSRKIGQVTEEGRVSPAGSGMLAKITPGKVLTDAEGKPLTVGGAFDHWITTSSGNSRAVAALFRGSLDINEAGTEANAILQTPAAAANALLKPVEHGEMQGLLQRRDAPPGTPEDVKQAWNQGAAKAKERKPDGSAKSVYDLMADGSIDEKVRTALGANEDLRVWESDELYATGSVVAVARDDGTIAPYHTQSSPAEPVKKFNEAQKKLNRLTKKMGESNPLVNDMMQWDGQAKDLSTQLGRAVKVADEKARALDGTARFEVPSTTSKRPKVVHLSLAKQAGAIFGENGVIDQLIKAIDNRNFAQVHALAGVADRRLSKTGVKSIDSAMDPAFQAVHQMARDLRDYARRRIDYQLRVTKALESHDKTGIKAELSAYLKAHRAYVKSVWDHPSGDWVPVLRDQFLKNVLDVRKGTQYVEDMAQQLKGMTDDQFEAIMRDPKRMAEAIVVETDAAMTNPVGAQIISKEEMDTFKRDAIDQTNKLRQEGEQVVWFPHVTSLDARDLDPGRYGVHISTKGLVKTPSGAYGRTVSLVPERYDMKAALSLRAKESLQRDGTIEFVNTHLVPHMLHAGQMWEWVKREFPDQVAGLAGEPGNLLDQVSTLIDRKLGYVKYDPVAKFGFFPPRFARGTDLYLPRALAESLDKLVQKSQFPLDGVWEKGTNLFRFSILGLSPRYTAHIVFGGAFFMALRSSPYVFTYMPEAYRLLKEGKVPRGTLGRATEIGAPEISNRAVTPESLRSAGTRAFHQAGGGSLAYLNVQEELEHGMGISWKAANPVQWAKAAANVNFRFTNYVVDMYRTTAYLDHLRKAQRTKFRDPITGERVAITRERAEREAIKHSLKVMGNLKAMTAFERNTMTRLMPFYGWTRHVLAYVLSYPVDHPFRAMWLSTLADQDSAGVNPALDKRIQFLFYLGSPSADGSVSAVDLRFMDPLRDTANYATLQGWISALNPFITAPLAVINPQMVYGGNTLYPNVSYDQFYGIETAGSQGSPLNAAEQIVPQLTALDAALNLSGQYRTQAATNPTGFAKTIFEALNIPFAQVQHLNLHQLEAKNEMARYKVSSQLAQNAFSSGDFSSISRLPSVVDPQYGGSTYDISTSTLEELYNQLLAQYPGLPPESTVPAAPYANI